MKKLTKRGLALFLALVMCLGMVNITVYATDGELTDSTEVTESAETTDNNPAADGSEVAGIEDNSSEDADIEDDGTEDADIEDDGSEDDGSEDADIKDDGSEDDGSEDDGSEDDGSEDADIKDDGSEDDGSEDADIKDDGTEDADIEDDGTEDNGSAESKDPAEESEYPTENPDNGIALMSLEDEDNTEKSEETGLTAIIEWNGYGSYTLTFTGTGVVDNDTVLNDGNTLGRLDATSKAGQLTAVTVNGEITIADGVFQGCTGLETVSLSGGVTVGKDAFAGCSSLSKIFIDGVTSIGENAFGTTNAAAWGTASTELRLDSLTELTLKNVGYIGKWAFKDCKALKTVTMEQVGTVVSVAFTGCGALEHVELTDVDMIGDSVSTVFPSGSPSITVTRCNISKYAFYMGGCTEVTIIDSTVGERAFYNCKSLEKVTMTNVSSVGNYAFYGCSALKEVVLNDVTIDAATSAKYAPFYNVGATGMTLTMAGGEIGQYAFAGSKLASVQLSDVSSVGTYAFYSCNSLVTASLSDVASIGRYAFYNSSNLSSVELSNVASIGGNAFYGTAVDHFDGITADTQLGYLKAGTLIGDEAIDGLSERVAAILRGGFKLDNAPEIQELALDETGWDDGHVAQSGNWDSYDNGTQIMEQARWTDEAKTEAEVQVDVYYTAPKQMDFIFVADLSNSMADMGNAADQNARFYDMQSKLLDVTGQLLNSSDYYDCQVAIVTFGGSSSSNLNYTVEVQQFTDDAATAQNFINGLKPYYEGTDYGLGLKKALELINGNTDRNTTVIFLSDGAPTTGSSGDMTGVTAAKKIAAAGVDIYGVLHSPDGDGTDARTAMNNVCTEVFESHDTKSFGEAMNLAFAAAYPDYTVTIPVNEDFENVRTLSVSVSAGEASYNADTHTITWTITGMPFTRHTLTYRMSLVDNEANCTEAGDYTYPVNSGNAYVVDGASVETPVLSRTVEEPYTPSTPTTPTTSSVSRYTLTINYVDEDGNVLANVHSERLVSGARYSVASPELEGYTPDQPVVSGTMPAHSVEVTVTYTANTTELPEEDPPLAEAPDEETPDTEAPIEEEPDVEIPDEDIPLTDLPDVDDSEVDIPDEDIPLTDIPDEKVPLSSVPQTGDNTGLWCALAMLSAFALAALSFGKKREDR